MSSLLLSDASTAADGKDKENGFEQKQQNMMKQQPILPLLSPNKTSEMPVPSSPFPPLLLSPGKSPSNANNAGPKLILAIDVGTTVAKCCVFSSGSGRCGLVHSQQEKLSLLVSSDDELVEMDSEVLWEQIKRMIRGALAKCSGHGTVHAIGLSCQRNTFLTWDRRSLKPCHQLITWKDNRARHFCAEWNQSWSRKLLNLFGLLAHFFSRSQRFKAARIFRLLGAMVPPRFLVTLEKHQNMRTLLGAGELALGTMDCWLLQKLSGGKAFVTEPSAASSTGMFDPFTGTWGHQILSLLHFPVQVLPPLVDTTRLGVFTDPNLFGHAIPIAASLGDSQAAAFGAGCVRRGDVKVSLGTGTLLDYVSGREVHASMCGMYPLVGWKMHKAEHATHLLEGRANDTASALEWAHTVGILDSLDAPELEEWSRKAAQADLGDGHLCFVPAFSGLQTPLDDDGACAALIGIRSRTSREQIFRAVLESIAFGVYQIWECLLQEVPEARHTTCRIRLCGGVSLNDFICQQIATLLGRPVERVREPQFCSAKGAALLAGISAGLWTVVRAEELVEVERLFEPVKGERSALLARFRLWQRAEQRCLHYYNGTDGKEEGHGQAD